VYAVLSVDLKLRSAFTVLYNFINTSRTIPLSRFVVVG
jgi:hypothetical protein